MSDPVAAAGSTSHEDVEPAPGALMAAEIAEQPALLHGLLDSSRTEVAAVVSRLRSENPRFVVLAARGSSDHAAVYAKYLLETMLGIPTGLASMSSYTVYDAPILLNGGLWVAVSQSGGSPDLVESTRIARANGATTLAITNDPESALARESELHLDVRAGPERSVAATKTYTCSLFTIWLWVATWAGADVRSARTLPDLASRALETPGVPEAARHFHRADTMVTTSRGYSYCTALEAALKLMETCYVSAHAFSAADLMHGPIAMVREGQPVVMVLPEGRAGRAMSEVVQRLLDACADLCVVGSSPIDRQPFLPVPDGAPETLRPVIEVIALQRLAWTMAIARGLDPDRPRALSKVTHTR